MEQRNQKINKILEDGLFETKTEIALALGMRQPSQLDRVNEARLDMAEWIFSNLEPFQREQQVEFGRNLSFGFQPGEMSQDVFGAAAAKTRLAPNMKSLARRVLVGGESVNSVVSGISVSSQVLDQACISITRQSSVQSAALKDTVKWASARFNSMSDSIDPNLVLAALCQISVDELALQVSGKQIPNFTQAAFYSMFVMMSDELIKAVFERYEDFFEKLEHMTFKTKSTYRTVLGLSDVFSGKVLIQYMANPLRYIGPTLKDIDTYVAELDRLLNLSPKKIRSLSLTGTRSRGIYDLESVDKAISSTGSLNEAIHRTYPDEAYVNVYKAYQSWKLTSKKKWWGKLDFKKAA